MRRAAVACVAIAVLSSGCGLGAGGPAELLALVDHTHDEYAAAFTDYFPRRIEVRPGDTVVFAQNWTGEPHSVTLGTKVNELGELMKPYLRTFYEKGWSALPPEPPKDIAALEEQLPWMIDDDGKAAQNGAQPCYLRTGVPPKDPAEPCPDGARRQPEFDGRHSYYNSGFIPYEGQAGNRWTLTVADDAEPGEHFFYCNYHGEFMSGFLVVREPDADVPSAEQVTRAARRQIDVAAQPLLRAFRAAQRGRWEPPETMAESLGPDLTRTVGDKTYFRGRLAGLTDENVHTAFINEFIPKRTEAKAGEAITWVMLGFHTISFNVPEYFPIIEVAENGTVTRNPRLDPPAGGAPKVDIPEGPGPSDGPPEPIVVDAGTWDGEGFWSSGTIAGDPYLRYTLRITKKGTYRYACLIHPPMVGTLVVT